ncbi:uncharacterized protein METZ01_LOCUS640 [marine metagenome]|uniref:Uncharacterized protein n=1 Tax=marine metagenome TaxID=408172 RepID=A0A381MZM6_9ZZZZ
MFVLAGCAFEPLYKSESFGVFHIKRSDVQVMNTDLVYKELKRFFNNDDVNARFVVAFIIDEQYEDIDVREDEKVLRKNITNKLDFTVTDNITKKVVFSGQSLVSSAFNRVAEPYANYVAESNTKKQISILLAEDIQKQLLLFKNRYRGN